MGEDAEPSENIGAGNHGGVPLDLPATNQPTNAERVVDRLGDLYWQKTYGGQDAFPCLVRTILSQNTSDKTSQPAFDDLCEIYAADDLAVALANANHDDIADTIRSAGLYNQKATVLQSAATHIIATYGGTHEFDTFVKTEPPRVVRDALLGISGVGPKTADCVLLFAGGRDGVFPVDTHVHRIYRRLGIAPPDADHETIRSILEAQVPPEKCGFGHTTSIQFGREYCTARRPACLSAPDACPLEDVCDQIGVTPETGDVTDPADTIP